LDKEMYQTPRMTQEAARVFISKVKAFLSQQPGRYEQFLDVLYRYKEVRSCSDAFRRSLRKVPYFYNLPERRKSQLDVSQIFTSNSYAFHFA